MSRFAWIVPVLLVTARLLVMPAVADDNMACGDRKATPEQRIAACTRIVASGGDTAWALVARGNAYFDSNERDRAIADYSEAIRLSPTYALAFNNRAYAYMDKGELDQAVVDANTAIMLKPKFATAFDSRGNIFEKQGNLDRALTDFTQAIRLDPGDPATLVRRGLIYERKDDIARARADYEAALALPAGGRAGDWAHETARQRLAALSTPPAAPSPQTHAPPTPRPSPVKAAAATPKPAAPHRKTATATDAAPVRPSMPPTPPPAAEAPAADVVSTASMVRETSAEAQVPAPAPAAAAPAAPAPEVVAATPETTATATAPGAMLAAAAPVVVQAERPAASSPGGRNISAVGRRVALAIGNGHYTALPAISSPINDASDVAAALKALGFEVSVGLDLNRLAMEDLLIRFARDVRGADTAVFYYGGHSIQHAGENFLAPVDARIDDEADLRRLVRLNDIIADLHGANRVRVLILDASRDNDVARKAAATLPAPRAAAFARGLAWLPGADGTLVIFAAQANRTVADPKGRNSAFTQALLRHLPAPGLEFRTLMARVRADVVAATGGTQRPELYDSLVSEFTLQAAQ